MTLPERPSRFVVSPDGTRTAVFTAGTGPPLLLVHGTTADHRTWRVVGPELARRWTIHAVDRRGRGDSGDAATYAIERELDDIAAVAGELAASAGLAIDVIGHSLGGRIALGASLRSPAIGRIVAYESAPLAPGEAALDPDLDARLRADLAAGDLDGMLARFMTEAIGMPPADLQAFRDNPIWPLRVAAAPTILRELEAAEHDSAVGLDALASVSVPVLQLCGALSPASFRLGAEALDRRLVRGELAIIDGARHGGHHSHAGVFLALAEAFLRRPPAARAGQSGLPSTP
ncbi:MAG TPA: alpha/beta hydrolase [Candidatus Limnocylindrales bacterium]